MTDDSSLIYKIYLLNYLQMRTQFCFLKQIPQKANELDSKLSTLSLTKTNGEYFLYPSDSDPIQITAQLTKESLIADVKWGKVPDGKKQYVIITTKQQRIYVISGNQRDMELWYDGLRCNFMDAEPETDTSQEFIAKITAAGALCQQEIPEIPEIPPPPDNLDYE